MKSNIFSMDDKRKNKGQQAELTDRVNKLEIENSELAYEVKRLTATLNKLLRLLKAERVSSSPKE